MGSVMSEDVIRGNYLNTKGRGGRESGKRKRSKHEHRHVPTQDEGEEKEKIEKRRRLNEIVKDHLDDNGTVYDRPNAQGILKRRRNAWLMSSALVGDSSQGVPFSSSSSSLPLPSEKTSEDSEDSDDHEPGNEGKKNLTPVQALSLQSNKNMPARCTPRKPESSSSVLTTPTSPAIYTPKPLRFVGPRPRQFTDRVMPRILPTFAPTTDPNSLVDNSSGKKTKAVKDTGDTQREKSSMSEYHSDQGLSKTPIPGPEP